MKWFEAYFIKDAKNSKGEIESMLLMEIFDYT